MFFDWFVNELLVVFETWLRDSIGDIVPDEFKLLDELVVALDRLLFIAAA